MSKGKSEGEGKGGEESRKAAVGIRQWFAKNFIFF
jgi:hypothetical protein